LAKFDRAEVDANFRALIKPLCDTFGPSGYEDDCIELVKDRIKDYGTETSVDVMLNLTAFRRGNGRKKVLIAAHTDEIGLVIRRIDEQGWLWFETLGGVRPQQLFGKHIIIRTEDGFVHGVVNSKKPGRPEECTEVPPIADFFIDIGVDSRQEAIDLGIEVGNPVSLDYPLIFFGKNGEKVAGKALDNRACVFMLIELLRLVQDDNDIPDIYAVFSAQEEIGCRGAKIAAQRIKPDIAIALDISIATNVPDFPDRRTISRVGDGVVIKVLDKTPKGVTLCSREVVSGIKKAAKEANIKYQLETNAYGGTDISNIQTENGGVAVGGICLATRYAHSYEVSRVNEVVDCVELLYRYIKSLA
jgi:endoglucanase